MSVDLHIHTTASDGYFSPREILLKAVECSLSYIAITDHDTIDGIRQIEGIVLDNAPTVIPGIELSIDLPDNEVHLLGYYINLFNQELCEQLLIITKDRRRRIEKMVAKLNRFGYCITAEDIFSSTPNTTSIGRPCIAKALVKKGYFTTVPEVFRKLLYKNGPAYVPHYKLKPRQAIDIIKRCGGVPILAHPGLVKDDKIVIEMIQSGVAGLEVYHPSHSWEQTEKYKKLTERYSLIATGGSDFHGIPSRYPEELGIFTVPDELAIKLHQYSQALK